MRLTALLLLVLAQAVPPPQFKSGVNLVEVDVVVTDRSGMPVRGLKQDDFAIAEDGKPVEVMTFNAVDLPMAERAAIPPLDRSGTSGGSNDHAGNGRILLIVFDDYHVSFDAGRMGSARAIATRLVERMGPADLTAVVSASGRRGSRAEFTSDKARLLEAITAFFPQADTPAGGIATQSNPYGAPRTAGANMGGFGEIRARWSMDTLRNAATVLATIPHRRKAVLLVTQGLSISVEDIFRNQYASGAFQAFRDFIVIAQQSNVAIYPMDPCGLDEDTGCSTDSRQNLRSLAESTGGFAVTNTNAPERSVDRMVAESGTYYLIGYASPAKPHDGRQHRISVRVRRPDLQVRAREGYLADRQAPRPKAQTAAADTLIAAPIQSPGLTMNVVAVPAPIGSKPGATIAVGIEVRSLDAARAGTIDFTLVAVDSNGDVRSRQRFRSTFEARGTPAPGWARLGSRVDVPPGDYQIRLAAVDATGATGSVFTEVRVPKFTENLALGGLSLSTPALRSEKLAELISGIVPLVPMPTREFMAGTPIVAQLPVRATARGETAVSIEARVIPAAGTPIVVKGAGGGVGFTGPAGAVYQLSLPQLEPGSYRLAVDVTAGRERETREVAFSIASR